MPPLPERVEEEIKQLLTLLTDHVFAPLARDLSINPTMRRTLNPAFPWPHILKLGFLKRGLAIEFQGPSSPDGMMLIHVEDDTELSLAAFLGMDEGELAKSRRCYYGAPAINTNNYIGNSIARLNELHYDYMSSSEIATLNGYDDLEQSPHLDYWSNVTFFWTDDEGELRVRHVDFLLFFPADEPANAIEVRLDFDHLRRAILALPTPEFDVQRHNDLNRFIELLHADHTSETDITKFLTEVPELLQLGFSCGDINPQVTLEWQYPSDIPNLRPDFLPVGMDGFANILDFKLPGLKNVPMVGQPQRRHPSFEVDSAIAQLEMYDRWSSQDLNRRWLFESKGIRIHDPQRLIVMGRAVGFAAEERQRLRTTRRTLIYTYDEFIDMVRFQIYRAH